MKTLYTSFVLREIQIKNYNEITLHPTKMAIIKKTDNSKCWPNGEKSNPSPAAEGTVT